jgi:hypothetical protein
MAQPLTRAALELVRVWRSMIESPMLPQAVV